MNLEAITEQDKDIRLQSLQGLGDAEGATVEASSLREERELIKNRVVQMISTIEKLGI